MKIAKIKKIINAGENREQYFENPIADYFNIDKQNIRLINGVKKGSYIRHSPDHYGPADSFGYVVLSGFNCQARCHYCYLQSYFKSPDLVRFQNFDDFLFFINDFVIQFKNKYPDKVLIFYDGDYKDSLGYYGLQQNIENINKFTDILKKFKNVFLEIRTKNLLSDFRFYEKLDITENLIVAITFGTQRAIQSYEYGTSNFDLRFAFAKYVLKKGAKLGIRIDPVILDNEESLDEYLQIVKEMKKLDVYNYGVGLLRLKDNLYKYLKKKNSSMINGLVLEDGFRKYPKDRRKKFYEEIKTALNGEKFYFCMDEI